MTYIKSMSCCMIKQLHMRIGLKKGAQTQKLKQCSNMTERGISSESHTNSTFNREEVPNKTCHNKIHL